jgi:hypothetical protein
MQNVTCDLWCPLVMLAWPPKHVAVTVTQIYNCKQCPYLLVCLNNTFWLFSTFRSPARQIQAQCFRICRDSFLPNSGRVLQNMSRQLPSKFFTNVSFINQRSDLAMGRRVPDSIPGRGKRCSCSAKTYTTVLGPTQPSIQWVSGVLFPGGKRATAWSWLLCSAT